MSTTHADVSAAELSASPRVYVADAVSGELMLFLLDRQRATLERTQCVPLEAGAGPIAIAPNRRRLYATLRSDPPAIIACAIAASDGRLTRERTTTIADLPVYLGTDATGRFVLSASYNAASFAIHAVGADGGLASPARQALRTPPHAHCIITDPANRHLFVTSLGGDQILQFRFDSATGRVTPNEPPFLQTRSGMGPRHLVFHPAGSHAYANGELDGSVCVYDYDASLGRLAEVQRIDALPAAFADPPWGADLHIAPDGRSLYSSERRSQTLTVFAVDASSGRLDRLRTFAAHGRPRSFAIDPSGRFACVAGETSAQLALYRIDPATGAFELCAQYDVGEKPSWVGICAPPA